MSRLEDTRSAGRERGPRVGQRPQLAVEGLEILPSIWTYGHSIAISLISSFTPLRNCIGSRLRPDSSGEVETGYPTRATE